MATYFLCLKVVFIASSIILTTINAKDFEKSTFAQSVGGGEMDPLTHKANSKLHVFKYLHRYVPWFLFSSSKYW